jgi:hypothetical protein
VQKYDPTYQATKLHFEDLVKRYGSPIIVLNLIKVVFKFIFVLNIFKAFLEPVNRLLYRSCIILLYAIE